MHRYKLSVLACASVLAFALAAAPALAAKGGNGHGDGGGNGHGVGHDVRDHLIRRHRLTRTPIACHPRQSTIRRTAVLTTRSMLPIRTRLKTRTARLQIPTRLSITAGLRARRRKTLPRQTTPLTLRRMGTRAVTLPAIRRVARREIRPEAPLTPPRILPSRN